MILHFLCFNQCTAVLCCSLDVCVVSIVSNKTMATELGSARNGPLALWPDIHMYLDWKGTELYAGQTRDLFSHQLIILLDLTRTQSSKWWGDKWQILVTTAQAAQWQGAGRDKWRTLGGLNFCQQLSTQTWLFAPHINHYENFNQTRSCYKEAK